MNPTHNPSRCTTVTTTGSSIFTWHPILDEGESPETKKQVSKKRQKNSKAAPEEHFLSAGQSSSTTRRNLPKKAASARKGQLSEKKLSVLPRDASKDAV